MTGNFVQIEYVATIKGVGRISIDKEDLPKENESIEDWLSKVYGIQKTQCTEWMKWVEDGYPCRALNSRGKPCKCQVAEYNVTPAKFNSELTPFCAKHKDPNSRGYSRLAKTGGNLKARKTIKNRYAILKAANFKCQACGVTAQDAQLHIDHIKPLAKGGINDLSNFQVLCQSCNCSKGDSFGDGEGVT